MTKNGFSDWYQAAGKDQPNSSLRVRSSPNSAMVMPACSKIAQNTMAAMKNTNTAASRCPSMSPRMANQTMAAMGRSRNAARSHWNRGSSESTVSARMARVPAMTSRLGPQDAPRAISGARPTPASSFARRT